MRQNISVNKIFLVGTLGKDAETRATGSGKEVVSFSLATSRSYKKADGSYENITDWHNITGWTPNDNVKNLSKGDKVSIVGSIAYETYEKDGVKKYITKINADEIMINSKKDGNYTSSSSQPSDGSGNSSRNDSPSHPNDDLPF